MGSYWLEEEAPPVRTRALDGRPEVVVVGGGVTGCSCALTLAEAGVRVRLHEAREIAGGASGRNGGFALRGAAPAYDVARATLGSERAAEIWRLTERYVDRIEELAGDAFRRVGSFRLAFDDGERENLRREHDALREDGFAVEWHEALEPPLDRLFGGAILHPSDGALYPARWVRRLAARAAAAGAEIREHSRAEALDELDADQVVVASDGYPSGLLPEAEAVIRPTRGQVIVTAPLAQQLYPRPHYARQGYDYWHQLPDGRLVLGGKRDLSLETEATAEEATTPAIQRALERFAEELLGEAPTITHRWAGIFGSSPDQLPLVGPVPGRDGVWISSGYSGHGNVLGLACGDLVARAIVGDPHPLLDLFDPSRLVAPAAVREARSAS